MRRQKTKLLLFGLTLFGSVSGFYLLNVYDCGNSIFCYHLTTNAFALYYSMGALALVFLLLVIFPIATHAWKLFAVWFIPIALDFFVLYEGPGHGFFSIGPSQEEVYRFFAMLYIIVSVGIIATVLLRKKLGKRREPQPWSMRKKLIFWGAWGLIVVLPVLNDFWDFFTG